MHTIAVLNKYIFIFKALLIKPRIVWIHTLQRLNFLCLENYVTKPEILMVTMTAFLTWFPQEKC